MKPFADIKVIWYTNCNAQYKVGYKLHSQYKVDYKIHSQYKVGYKLHPQ